MSDIESEISESKKELERITKYIANLKQRTEAKEKELKLREQQLNEREKRLKISESAFRKKIQILQVFILCNLFIEFLFQF